MGVRKQRTDVGDIHLLLVSTLLQITHPRLTERLASRVLLQTGQRMSPNNCGMLTTRTPFAGTRRGYRNVSSLRIKHVRKLNTYVANAAKLGVIEHRRRIAHAFRDVRRQIKHSDNGFGNKANDALAEALEESRCPFLFDTSYGLELKMRVNSMISTLRHVQLTMRPPAALARLLPNASAPAVTP